MAWSRTCAHGARDGVVSLVFLDVKCQNDVEGGERRGAHEHGRCATDGLCGMRSGIRCCRVDLVLEPAFRPTRKRRLDRVEPSPIPRRLPGSSARPRPRRRAGSVARRAGGPRFPERASAGRRSARCRGAWGAGRPPATHDLHRQVVGSSQLAASAPARAGPLGSGARGACRVGGPPRHPAGGQPAAPLRVSTRAVSCGSASGSQPRA